MEVRRRRRRASQPVPGRRAPSTDPAEPGPERFPAAGRPGADPQRDALLGADPEPGVQRPGPVALREDAGQEGVRPGGLHHHHGGGRPVRRPGEVPEFVVPAVRGRQPVPRPEPVERGGLAVVAGQQHGVRPLRGREALVDLGDLADVLRPAERVAQADVDARDRVAGQPGRRQHRQGDQGRQHRVRADRADRGPPGQRARGDPPGHLDRAEDVDRQGQPDRVVEPAADQQEQDQDGGVADHQGAQRAQLRAPERADGAQPPDDQQRRAEDDQLPGHQHQPVQLAVLGPQRPGHLQLRQPVAELVDQVRQPDQDGQPEPGPRPGGGQHPAGPGQQQARGQPDQQQHDQALGVEPDAGHHPRGEPGQSLVMQQGPGHQPADGEPDRQVEAPGGQQVPAQQREAGCPAERGQGLRGRAAAELAGQQGEQDDQDDGRPDRGQPQGPEGVAEQGGGGPAGQWDQRWLVDVAPVRVRAQQPEVELVPVVAVPVHGRRQQGHHARGDQPDRDQGQWRPLLPGHPPTLGNPGRDRPSISGDGRPRGAHHRPCPPSQHGTGGRYVTNVWRPGAGSRRRRAGGGRGGGRRRGRDRQQRGEGVLRRGGRQRGGVDRPAAVLDDLLAQREDVPQRLTGPVEGRHLADPVLVQVPDRRLRRPAHLQRLTEVGEQLDALQRAALAVVREHVADLAALRPQPLLGRLDPAVDVHHGPDPDVAEHDRQLDQHRHVHRQQDDPQQPRAAGPGPATELRAEQDQQQQDQPPGDGGRDRLRPAGVHQLAEQHGGEPAAQRPPQHGADPEPLGRQRPPGLPLGPLVRRPRLPGRLRRGLGQSRAAASPGGAAGRQVGRGAQFGRVDDRVGQLAAGLQQGLGDVRPEPVGELLDHVRSQVVQLRPDRGHEPGHLGPDHLCAHAVAPCASCSSADMVSANVVQVFDCSSSMVRPCRLMP